MDTKQNEKHTSTFLPIFSVFAYDLMDEAEHDSDYDPEDDGENFSCFVYFQDHRIQLWYYLINIMKIYINIKTQPIS